MSNSKQISPGIFRYPIDLVSVAVVLLCVGLQITCVLLKWPWYLLAIVLPLVRQLHLVEHNHAHVYIFRRRWLNDVLGWMCFLANGVPLEFYEVHHVSNHHRFNQRFDASEQDWSSTFGFSGTRFPDKPINPTYYALTFPVITTCHCLIALLRTPTSSRTRRFAISCAVVSISCAVLATMNYKGLLVFVGIPWLAVLLSLGWGNYGHHHKCGMTTPYDTANVNLRLYARLLGFNIGYHVAHHLKPGLHWSELPRFHASIAREIPEERYMRPLRALLPSRKRAVSN